MKTFFVYFFAALPFLFMLLLTPVAYAVTSVRVGWDMAKEIVEDLTDRLID